MTEGFEWGVHVQRPVSADLAGELVEAGVNRVTVPLPWRWYQRAPGAPDLAAIDHFLAPLRFAAVPLQGMLGPAMPHALPDGVDPDTPDFVERFATACAAVASAVPDVTVFRVEDSLNAAPLERFVFRRRRGNAWRSAAFRQELLLATAAAVRAARPDAQLRVTVHAGLPGWRRSLASWLDAGLDVSRVGLVLQPCFFLPDPRLARACADAVRAARELGPLPVEIARIAYPTSGGRFSPRRQREFLETAARSALDAGAAGLHWWVLRDQAHDDPVLGYWTPPQERHYGLLYYDGVHKPALDALRVEATGDRFGQGGGTS